MINITKLYCGKPTPGDWLRYEHARRAPRPVVVWNCTRRCNLRCVHCYLDAGECSDSSGDLTTQEARVMIEDLAAFGAPVLLFSGGEPLIREDIFELAEYARELGIRPVLSTNGTLIDKTTATRLKNAGFAYVGVSLDGMRATNNKFRKSADAFDRALAGIESCLAIDQKVGLRLTMTSGNIQDLPAILNLIRDAGIPRACFYHLVYSGRGKEIAEDDLSPEQKRAALDMIMDRTREFDEAGLGKDILTVDNHCDGPYLYLRLLREDPERAAEALKLLEANGGNRTGIGIGCIDSQGDVHPDQFWRDCTLGNIRQRLFSEIWSDLSNPIMAGLRDRKPLLKGRCAQTNCRWIDVCNGNFRARAVAIYDDPWMQDPACYLTDDEIARQEVS
jgi:radical SAM protein with 4Fe4S-binding SPASM domain